MHIVLFAIGAICAVAGSLHLRGIVAGAMAAVLCVLGASLLIDQTIVSLWPTDSSAQLELLPVFATIGITTASLAQLCPTVVLHAGATVALVVAATHACQTDAWLAKDMPTCMAATRTSLILEACASGLVVLALMFLDGRESHHALATALVGSTLACTYQSSQCPPSFICCAVYAL